MLKDEDQLEVVRINAGVAATSLFKIDVPTASKSIGFSTQAPRAELDNYVESVQVLQPAGLTTSQELCGGEIL